MGLIMRGIEHNKRTLVQTHSKLRELRELMLNLRKHINKVEIKLVHLNEKIGHDLSEILTRLDIMQGNDLKALITDHFNNILIPKSLKSSLIDYLFFLINTMQSINEPINVSVDIKNELQQHIQTTSECSISLKQYIKTYSTQFSKCKENTIVGELKVVYPVCIDSYNIQSSQLIVTNASQHLESIKKTYSTIQSNIKVKTTAINGALYRLLYGYDLKIRELQVEIGISTSEIERRNRCLKRVNTVHNKLLTANKDCNNALYIHHTFDNSKLTNCLTSIEKLNKNHDTMRILSQEIRKISSNATYTSNKMAEIIKEVATLVQDKKSKLETIERLSLQYSIFYNVLNYINSMLT